MNNFYSFKINKKEALNFGKLSGDKNEIHTNNLAGHNSIFGTIVST